MKVFYAVLVFVSFLSVIAAAGAEKWVGAGIAAALLFLFTYRMERSP